MVSLSSLMFGKLKFLFKRTMLFILNNKILTLILIVAALLRFIGTNPGYNQFHSDQGISYSAATSMIKNGNFDPLRYDYPALVPDINYLFFQFFFIPLSWAKYYITHIPDIIDGIVHIPIAPLEAKKIFQVYILGEREINAIFWSRYVTALFSLGNVFLTYLLAKKFFERLGNKSHYIGLIAATLLAFNYKHVANAHLGLPDIYNAFFVLCSLILNLNLWKNPNRKNYLLAGLAVGLSFSVKYQIFAFFPFLLTHLYLSFEKGRLNIRKLFNPGFLLALVAIPFTLAITNPYFFIHFQKALKAIQDVSQKYGIGTNKLTLYPIWYMYNIDYGGPQLLAIFLGLVLGLRKFFRETLLIFAYLAPFIFVFFYYSGGGFYVRNFITIAPLLLIFAGYSIFVSLNFFIERTNRFVGIILTALILAVMVYIPGQNAIINSYYYTKPWGYDVLRSYLQANLPKDAVIAAHPFEISRGAVGNKRTEFEIDGSYSLAEHREDGANYALINLDWAGNPFYFWMSFGIEDLEKYWNKPYEIMRNTYHGIAAEELFRYQVFSTFKPPQAPESALILAKLPDWPQVEMARIKNFNFKDGLEGWVIQSSKTKNEFEFDEAVGFSENGSIVLLSGVDKGVRMASSPIRVKSGFLYRINSYLKMERELGPRERDGFIRIDFYKDEYSQNKLGMEPSVSSRVYGTTDWIKKEIVARAPENAKFMTVSFSANHANKIWLDDITVEESKIEVLDIIAKPPYIKKDVDLNLLYPNSHGNL